MVAATARTSIAKAMRMNAAASAGAIECLCSLPHHARVASLAIDGAIQSMPLPAPQALGQRA